MGRIRKRVLALLLLCPVFLFTACGPQGLPGSGNVPNEDSEVVDGEVQEIIVEEPKEPYDLMTQEWIPPQELQNPKHWWQVETFVDGLVELPEGRKSSWQCTASDGAKFYVVSSLPIYDEADPTVWVKSDYYLTCFDSNTMEKSGMFLSMDELGEDISVEKIVATGDRIMLFLQQMEGEERNTVHYYAAWLQEDGTLGEYVDLLPAIEQCGNKPEPRRAFNRMEWDSNGYFFCWDEDYNRVHIIDPKGNILDTMEVREGYSLSVSCTSPDGHLIWEESSWEEDTLTFFYYGEEGRKQLYSGPSFYITSCFMNGYGELYFPLNGALVRWNASNGNYERLLIAAGMESKMYDAILQNEEGNIVFVDYENGNYAASVYSLNGPAKTVKLTFTAVGICDFATRTYITEFMRKHPGVKIEIKESKGSMMDTDWTKLLTELTSGKGPDLMLLNRDEMLTLQEKGVLAELSGVLSEEVENSIFEGILDCGKVGNDLYAMVYQGRFSTLMVSKDIWQESTWTIEDVLDTLDKLEQEGRPVESFCSSLWYEGGVTGELMFNLLIYDILNSSFVDMSKGTCNFESEDFYRLLEVCKEFNLTEKRSIMNINQSRRDEVRKEALEGKYLAYDGMGMDYSLSRFSESMAGMSNYHFVGYPTGGNCGNFWDVYSMIVVNANAEEREIIDEFLRYLYTKECQLNNFNDSIIVRKDLLEDTVRYSASTGECYQSFGNGVIVDLETKPDGSSYLNEYLAFLDSCLPEPAGVSDIQRILYEETAPFFAGDKSAEEVVKVIQSRVQLYLDEHR